MNMPTTCIRCDKVFPIGPYCRDEKGNWYCIPCWQDIHKAEWDLEYGIVRGAANPPLSKSDKALARQAIDEAIKVSSENADWLEDLKNGGAK